MAGRKCKVQNGEIHLWLTSFSLKIRGEMVED